MAKVLVVDDEEQIRHMLIDMLELDGHRVEVEADGAKALERLDASFDVLITDIIMPNKTGLELIDVVKHVAPSLSIIVMSGGGTLNGATSALDKNELGVYGVVHKPFRYKDLKTLLDGLVLTRL